MATVTAVPHMRAGGRASERWFFVWMAALSAAIALVGFTWRYFLPLSAGQLHVPVIVHVHGLTMWAWTLWFLMQTWLAASGRVRHHRLFGMAGISLVTLAVWTGIVVALQQLDRRLAVGDGDLARAFVAQPLSLVAMMAVLFAAAIANARRIDVHSRLMLLVTLVALQPALARIIAVVTGVSNPVVNGPVAGVIVLLLVGVAMGHDVRQRGSPHSAYVWGGALIAVVQIARVTLVHTPAWYAITDVLVALVR